MSIGARSEMSRSASMSTLCSATCVNTKTQPLGRRRIEFPQCVDPVLLEFFPAEMGKSRVQEPECEAALFCFVAQSLEGLLRQVYGLRIQSTQAPEDACSRASL